MGARLAATPRDRRVPSWPVALTARRFGTMLRRGIIWRGARPAVAIESWGDYTVSKTHLFREALGF